MKKSYLIIFLAFASCVPARKYGDLESQHKALIENKKLSDQEMAEIKANSIMLKEDIAYLKDRLDALRLDSSETHSMYDKSRMLYENLRDTYKEVIENSKSSTQQLTISLKELEAKLAEREKVLIEKEAALLSNATKNERLSADLEVFRKDLAVLKSSLENEKGRVLELSKTLQAKDSAVKAIKTKLSQALLSYEGNGLSVVEKNGNVYVSMDEKLLFASGSIQVDAKGKQALLDLANSIKEIADLTIIVEGHTDDVPMKSASIKDNWDLSVLRATSIVRILVQEGKVNPELFMAAGRAEFHPLNPNKTKEERAKNRRTEIILSPKLAEIFNLLQND
jgi:chemotaxis protein MotB